MKLTDRNEGAGRRDYRTTGMPMTRSSGTMPWAERPPEIATHQAAHPDIGSERDDEGVHLRSLHHQIAVAEADYAADANGEQQATPGTTSHSTGARV